MRKLYAFLRAKLSPCLVSCHPFGPPHTLCACSPPIQTKVYIICVQSVQSTWAVRIAPKSRAGNILVFCLNTIAHHVDWFF